MTRSILPPRLRNWQPGQVQVGLFIRTDDGHVVECSWDKANKLAEQAAYDLLHILSTGERRKRDAKRPRKGKRT